MQLVPMQNAVSDASGVAAKSKVIFKIKSFKYWTILVYLNKVLNGESIAPIHIVTLNKVIPMLLAFWAESYPDVMTINAHLLLHVTDSIKLFGPPVYWNNYSNEGYIGRLKPYYKNTNNKSIEKSVYTMYRATVFIEMLLKSSGESAYMYHKDIFEKFATDETLTLTNYNSVAIMDNDNKIMTYGSREFLAIPYDINHFPKIFKHNHEIYKAGDCICCLNHDGIIAAGYLQSIVVSNENTLCIVYTLLRRNDFYFRDNLKYVGTYILSNIYYSSDEVEPKLYISPITHLIKRYKTIRIDNIINCI